MAGTSTVLSPRRWAVALVVVFAGLFLLASGAFVASANAQSATTSGTSTQTATATISLNPSTDSVGANVTIKGSGFPPGSTVAATFGNQTLQLAGACRADASGALASCSFKVPNAGDGAHQLTVTAGGISSSAEFTIPSVGIPESTFLVTLTSVGLGLVIQLVTRRVVNLDAERRMKAEVNSFNKEKREATYEIARLKKQDQTHAVVEQTKQAQAKLDKLKKRELQVRQDQAKLQTARLKVSAITFIPLLLVYYLMASFLGGYNVVVARAPFVIWPIINSDGSMVLFWWYMLSSFTFSTMLSRLLHTTT